MSVKKKILLAIGLIFVAGVVAHLFLPDGLDGWFFLSGNGDTTVYAPGYTDSAFRHVHVGMTEAEVRKLLVPPLDVWEIRSRDDTIRVEGIGMAWAKSSVKGNYRIRSLFLTNGVVAKKFKEYWID